jgi:hypothetical protein
MVLTVNSDFSLNIIKRLGFVTEICVSSEVRNESLYIIQKKGLMTGFPPVEAGSNASTVALRVVGADEKESQCLGV